ASGLQLTHDLEETAKVPHKTAVIGFPADPWEARSQAVRLLDEMDPQVLVVVEKPSRTPSGRYYNGAGVDVTDDSAKVDFLVDEARERGIPTVAFGDGGNEIGVGMIAESIRLHVPGGDLVGAVTEADYLVVASASAWRVYGTIACLAVMLGRPELLLREEAECRLLEA